MVQAALASTRVCSAVGGLVVAIERQSTLDEEVPEVLGISCEVTVLRVDQARSGQLLDVLAEVLRVCCAD